MFIGLHTAKPLSKEYNNVIAEKTKLKTKKSVLIMQLNFSSGVEN